MNKTLFLIVTLMPLCGLAASSRENRANKKLELTVQVGLDYRMSPEQVSAMYFLNSDNLIGVKIGADREGKNERQTNAAIQYKHFTGNSFYFVPEIFYLNTRENITSWLNWRGNKDEFAEYRSMGAGIRIGNQWTWKNFTVGCDWVGVGHRIGTFKKETHKLEQTTFTLLNFMIGASF